MTGRERIILFYLAQTNEHVMMQFQFINNKPHQLLSLK